MNVRGTSPCCGACGWIFLGAKSLGLKIRTCFPFAGSVGLQNGVSSVVTPHPVTAKTAGTVLFLAPSLVLAIGLLLHLPLVKQIYCFQFTFRQSAVRLAVPWRVCARGVSRVNCLLTSVARFSRELPAWSWFFPAFGACVFNSSSLVYCRHFPPVYHLPCKYKLFFNCILVQQWKSSGFSLGVFCFFLFFFKSDSFVYTIRSVESYVGFFFFPKLESEFSQRGMLLNTLNQREERLVSERWGL